MRAKHLRIFCKSTEEKNVMAEEKDNKHLGAEPVLASWPFEKVRTEHTGAILQLTLGPDETDAHVYFSVVGHVVDVHFPEIKGTILEPTPNGEFQIHVGDYVKITGYRENSLTHITGQTIELVARAEDFEQIGNH
jgi:hypothetical protein